MTSEEAVVGVVVKYYHQGMTDFIYNNRIGIIYGYGVIGNIRYIRFDDNFKIVASLDHLFALSSEEAEQYRETVARQKYAMRLL